MYLQLRSKNQTARDEKQYFLPQQVREIWSTNNRQP